MLNVNIGLGVDAEGLSAQLTGKEIHYSQSLTLNGLEGGMLSGKPSVAIVIDNEDGSVTLAETSLALLVSATRALVAKYGDPTTDDIVAENRQG